MGGEPSKGSGVGRKQNGAADETEEGREMDVKVKNFNVDMNIKAKGLELEVRNPGGTAHLGDCFVTMTGITWCKGRTTKKNVVAVSWGDLQTILASPEAKKAALAAARNC